MGTWILKATIYFTIFSALMILMPGADVLPLNAQFTSILSTIFSLIKLARGWPIIDEFMKGFNIFMYFIAIKITWNTIIFILSRFEDLRTLRKLTI